MTDKRLPLFVRYCRRTDTMASRPMLLVLMMTISKTTNRNRQYVEHGHALQLHINPVS